MINSENFNAEFVRNIQSDIPNDRALMMRDIIDTALRSGTYVYYGTQHPLLYWLEENGFCVEIIKAKEVQEWFPNFFPWWHEIAKVSWGSK